MMQMTMLVATLVVTAIASENQAQAGTNTASTKATATLAAQCNISATNINFGNIVGAPGNTVFSAAGNVSVLCNKNASYILRLNAGVNVYNYGRYLKGAVSGQTMNYAICQTPAFTGSWATGNCATGIWFSDGPYDYYISGTGTGAVQSYPMYGAIQTGYYTPDDYSDTIQASITF